MARRLTTIAKDITESLDGFTATCERAWGKKGFVLTVHHEAENRQVYTLDTSEPYRTNGDAEHWLDKMREAQALGLVPADRLPDGGVHVHYLMRIIRDKLEEQELARAELTPPLIALMTEMLQRALDHSPHRRAIPCGHWSDDPKNTSWADPKDAIRVSRIDGKHLLALGLATKAESGTSEYSLTPKGIQVALPHCKYDRIDVGEVVRHVLDTLVYFHPSPELDGEVAIPAIYKPGTSKLVLVLGENAGGKSFFRRLMWFETHRGKKGGFGESEIKRGPFPVYEFIGLSMQERTKGGFVGSVIYGHEELHSTGECSSRTVSTGIRTASGRAHTSVIWWDEPDIGMSAGSAAGAGILIREFVQNDAPLVQGVFITSHSVPLIRQLADLDPHYIYLGDADGPKNLDEWFESQQNPRPVLPEELQEVSRKRFRAIAEIIRSRSSGPAR